MSITIESSIGLQTFQQHAFSRMNFSGVWIRIGHVATFTPYDEYSLLHSV